MSNSPKQATLVDTEIFTSTAITDFNTDSLGWILRSPNDAFKVQPNRKASYDKFDILKQKIKKEIQQNPGKMATIIEKEINDLLNGELKEKDDIGVLELLCGSLADQLSEAGKKTSFGDRIIKLQDMLHQGRKDEIDLVYNDDVRTKLKQTTASADANDANQEQLKINKVDKDPAGTKGEADLSDVNANEPWYKGEVISIDQACSVFLKETKKDSGIANLDPIKDKSYEEKKAWLAERINACKNDINKEPVNAALKGNAQLRLKLLNRNFTKELSFDNKDFVERYLSTTNQAVMDKLNAAQEIYCEATRQFGEDKGFLNTAGRWVKNNTLAVKSGQEKGVWDKTKEFAKNALLFDAREDTLRKAKKTLDEAIAEADLKKIQPDGVDDSKSKARLYGGYNEEKKRMEFVLEYDTPEELEACLKGVVDIMNDRQGINRRMNFRSSVDKEQKSKWGMDNGVPCSYGKSRKPDACNEFLTASNKYFCPNRPPAPVSHDREKYKSEEDYKEAEKKSQEKLREYNEIKGRYEKEECEEVYGQTMLDKFASIKSGAPHWGSRDKNKQEVVDRYLGGSKAPGAEKALKAMIRQADKNIEEFKNRNGEKPSKDPELGEWKKEKAKHDKAEAFLKCVYASKTPGMKDKVDKLRDIIKAKKPATIVTNEESTEDKLRQQFSF